MDDLEDVLHEDLFGSGQLLDEVPDLEIVEDAVRSTADFWDIE